MWLDCSVGILLNLLVFTGPAGIGAIFSIAVIAQYIAFIIPVAIRVIFVRHNFRPGPWNLGKFSRPCGVIAIAWVILIIPIMCFPTVTRPNAVSMNWTCLVYGGTMAIILVWFRVDARKWFKGPKVISGQTKTVLSTGKCQASHVGSGNYCTTRIFQHRVSELRISPGKRWDDVLASHGICIYL